MSRGRKGKLRQAGKLKELSAAERRTRGMVRVYAKLSCGCCTEELLFKDLASAQRAFAEAGLDLSATITDDAGTVHKDIDTFYGFSRDRDDADGRGLGYLAGGI